MPKPAGEIGATGGRGTGPEPVTEAVGFVASLAFAEHLVDLLNDVAVIEPALAVLDFLPEVRAGVEPEPRGVVGGVVRLVEVVETVGPPRAGHAAGGGDLGEAGSPAAFMQESIVKIPCRPSMSGGTIAA